MFLVYLLISRIGSLKSTGLCAFVVLSLVDDEFVFAFGVVESELPAVVESLMVMRGRWPGKWLII